MKAYIRLDQYCRDRCWHSNFEHCAHDTCVDCYGNNDRSAKCVLLRGLSNAKNLELAVQFSVYIQNRAAVCLNILVPYLLAVQGYWHLSAACLSSITFS